MQPREQKTYSPRAGDIVRNWRVVDAEGKSLGRLASEVAGYLRGKHLPTFTPHADTGDFVVVVNAARVRVTGQKLRDKIYYRHSNYPGGFKAVSLGELLQRRPERVVEHTVRGMLPRNALGRKLLRKLKVYAGPTHPHQAQLVEAEQRLAALRERDRDRSAAPPTKQAPAASAAPAKKARPAASAAAAKKAPPAGEDITTEAALPTPAPTPTPEPAPVPEVEQVGETAPLAMNEEPTE